MSLAIPNTTATAQFVQWGGSLLANNGWIFAANGSIDVALLVGPTSALQSSSDVFTVPPGQSPLAQGSDEFINGILVRAADGVLSVPPQQYSGALFEAQRASIGAGTPFTGTVSSSGAITPGPTMINGITGIVSGAGAILAGTGYTSTPAGAGIYNIAFVPALAATPVIEITASNSGSLRNAIWTGASSSGFQVQIYDQTNTLAATGFSFLAVVPQ